MSRQPLLKKSNNGNSFDGKHVYHAVDAGFEKSSSQLALTEALAEVTKSLRTKTRAAYNTRFSRSDVISLGGSLLIGFLSGALFFTDSKAAAKRYFSGVDSHTAYQALIIVPCWFALLANFLFNTQSNKVIIDKAKTKRSEAEIKLTGDRGGKLIFILSLFVSIAAVLPLYYLSLDDKDNSVAYKILLAISAILNLPPNLEAAYNGLGDIFSLEIKSSLYHCFRGYKGFESKRAVGKVRKLMVARLRELADEVSMFDSLEFQNWLPDIFGEGFVMNLDKSPNSKSIDEAESSWDHVFDSLLTVSQKNDKPENRVQMSSIWKCVFAFLIPASIVCAIPPNVGFTMKTYLGTLTFLGSQVSETVKCLLAGVLAAAHGGPAVWFQKNGFSVSWTAVKKLIKGEKTVPMLEAPKAYWSLAIPFLIVAAGSGFTADGVVYSVAEKYIHGEETVATILSMIANLSTAFTFNAPQIYLLVVFMVSLYLTKREPKGNCDEKRRQKRIKMQIELPNQLEHLADVFNKMPTETFKTLLRNEKLFSNFFKEAVGRGEITKEEVRSLDEAYEKLYPELPSLRQIHQAV